MDGITISSFGFWAFLVGRGPGSFSRLAAMLVSHGPWHRYRRCEEPGQNPGARLAPSWSRPCEHKLLFIPLRRLLPGLRVWRSAVDSQLSKEFSWTLTTWSALSLCFSARSPAAVPVLPTSDSAAKDIYCYLTMQWSTDITHNSTENTLGADLRKKLSTDCVLC